MNLWIKVFTLNILINTLFLLGIALGLIDPDSEFIQNLCIILLLSLGLLHGCNDLSLLRQKALRNYKNISLKLLGYLAVIAFMLFFLFYTREIGILLFLLISAYHFGEEILESLLKRKTPVAYLLYIFYGINLFTLLFLGSYHELQDVLHEFGLSMFTYEVLRGITIVLFVIMTTALISFFFFGYLSFKNLLLLILLLVMILAASYLTNLLLTFTLIFVLFHSIPSIISQVLDIPKDNKKESFKEFLKRSLFIYMLSLGMLLFGYVYKDKFQSEDIILFTLAAVTVPHILLMALKKANAK